MGFWEFGGGRVWGKGRDRGGQFTSNLRPRWTDPVTARRVPSQYKGAERGARGDKGQSARGEEKARGMRHVYCNLCPCT